MAKNNSTPSDASTGSPSLNELKEGKQTSAAVASEKQSPDAATSSHPVVESPTDGTLGHGVDAPFPGTASHDIEKMEKVSVKTTGDFMIYDPYTSSSVLSECVEVPKTSFIASKIESKQLSEC